VAEAPLLRAGIREGAAGVREAAAVAAVTPAAALSHSEPLRVAVHDAQNKFASSRTLSRL
jgi:hypothetical protein